MTYLDRLMFQIDDGYAMLIRPNFYVVRIDSKMDTGSGESRASCPLPQ
jgi:hypothetical protein